MLVGVGMTRTVAVSLLVLSVEWEAGKTTRWPTGSPVRGGACWNTCALYKKNGDVGDRVDLGAFSQ